ncbi:hypothetical protein [Pedobacter alluvionis]|uniref:LPS export ABC transporter periplasmic protein LptC n=1 Tax=Pedobacter alluvionis TaxID=475253 RepID=A0A497Y1U2_9SPHI|nr:hypothetical protein [Pedobacter alluvionis]RLJ76841.1 hypothetical protein BCL90_1885 [Pedobacter alluvionis]TFB33898.1 hypothetical protein E3V97_07575 [Pedobacter alluvionis]
MMQQNLLFAVMILCTIGCKKSNPSGGVLVDLTNIIRIVNKNGQNLLDPSTPGSFKKDDIKIYYLVNGQKTEIFDSKLDAPRQFTTFRVKEDYKMYPNEYMMQIYSNSKGVIDQNGNEIATTYIEWNNANTDVIITQLRRSGASVSIDKVWCNGVVKWDIASTPIIEDTSFPGRFFQIIK